MKKQLSVEEEEFKDMINPPGRQSLNWNRLCELLPKVDPNSTDLSTNDAYEPTVLFLVAQRVEDTPECRRFIEALLNDKRVDFNVKSPMFKNSAFLWAISRYYEGEEGFGGLSCLYNGIHHCPLFVQMLFEKIKSDKKLSPLLTQPSENTGINSPLILALKNYNLDFAMQLVPFYNKEDLLIETVAGNTVLHLAAYFHFNPLIKAILDHAKTLGITDDLLNSKNRCGKTPAQCYMAEPLPGLEVENLFRNAGRINIGMLRLYDDALRHDHLNFENANWAAWAEIIMAQEFIALKTHQEGDHRYNLHSHRKDTDPAVVDLLCAQGADIHYANLDKMIVAKTVTEAERQEKKEKDAEAAKRTLTVYFGKSRQTYNSEDQEAEEHAAIVDALFKDSSNEGNFYITDFCKIGPDGFYPNKTIINLFKNPKDGESQPIVYQLCTKTATCALVSKAECIWDNEQSNKFNGGKTYKKSEDRDRSSVGRDYEDDDDDEDEDDIELTKPTNKIGSGRSDSQPATQNLAGSTAGKAQVNSSSVSSSVEHNEKDLSKVPLISSRDEQSDDHSITEINSIYSDLAQALTRMENQLNTDYQGPEKRRHLTGSEFNEAKKKDQKIRALLAAIADSKGTFAQDDLTLDQMEEAKNTFMAACEQAVYSDTIRNSVAIVVGAIIGIIVGGILGLVAAILATGGTAALLTVPTTAYLGAKIGAAVAVGAVCGITGACLGEATANKTVNKWRSDFFAVGSQIETMTEEEDPSRKVDGPIW